MIFRLPWGFRALGAGRTPTGDPSADKASCPRPARKPTGPVAQAFRQTPALWPEKPAISSAKLLWPYYEGFAKK
jgi:hypothetical protein